MPGRLVFLRPLAPLAKVVPLLALALFVYLLGDRLARFEVAGIGQALGQLSAWQWLGAVLLTVASFAAIGQYDAVIHRVLGTGVRPARARAAGMRAIALSQTVGFASLSGGLVRLRCLPELDLWTVTRLSLLVSLSFLGSWAVLAGGVVLFKHGGPAGLIPALLLLVGWRVARFRPAPQLPGLTPRAGLDLLLWTAIDTTCAALVLGVLLPAGLMPAFPTLFAAYLLALGAGLLSQSPAGLGAFELTLLILLPQVPEAPLLAAVLAYRVIYFLLPALLALALLIRPAWPPVPPLLHLAQGAARTRAMARAPRADWGLAHQGADVALSRDQAAGWLVRRAGRVLVALGQPLGQPDLTGLADMARTRALQPALYKCDARTACAARRSGWRVMRMSQEAVIDALRWSLTLPACRQLRRKLRSAADAGLRIEVGPAVLPWDQMARVNRDWAARNRGEKGFSMGQYGPRLLQHQSVVLGYVGDALVGFVSFHAGRDEWALDLMRHHALAPAGTMHALIAAGIGAAAAAGCGRVSLAAVPLLPGRLAGLNDRLPGAAGLRQFKRSFGPVWQPLYLCAPHHAGLLWAGVAVAWAVHLPKFRRSALGLTLGPALGLTLDPALDPALGPALGPARGPGPSGPAIDLPPCQHADFEIENPARPCDMPRERSRRAAATTPAAPRPSTGQPAHARITVQRPFPPA